MFGNVLRVAKFTGPLIRDEKEKAEKDRITGIYEAAKEAKKKGYVQFREVKPDDKFKESIQVVALTAKGKEVALNANITESQKISNKEQVKT
jgi:hypothetical protein